MLLSLEKQGVTPEELQRRLLAAADVVGPDGMTAEVQKALIELHRFVVDNIEVDITTGGRTRRSIFMNVFTDNAGVNGMLGSNVSYSPWVRDAGHGQQFFEYAARIEGPRVLERMSREFTLKVAGVMNG